MSALVSSFIPVDVGRRKYLFFLVAWNEFINPITEAVAQNREAFGESLGLHATVVQAYKGASYKVAKEVKEKAWPPEVDRRMGEEQYPFMVAVENDFAQFEPSLHRWGVVWFSDLERDPATLWKVFSALARKVQRGEDLFDYLRELSKNAKFKQAATYIEAKPGAFGVSINIKAIAEDLLQQPRS
jgi:hypothetical protein